ncbi:hypothetical protein [Streptomyces cyaneofuscatus]|uniref:hypothetical protein n=1 Tax=Streptomyces cyaneofuscatus TaxID=66883 RepID=UPI0037901A6E
MTVIGASDGRLVVPLAAAGYRVVAIERDPLALHGGEVQFPGGRRTNEFTEQAHVGQLQNHNHRMGLLLAARASTLS